MEIKIIGGGWSSLCLAHWLNRKGIVPTIISDSFDGGLMKSEQVAPDSWVDLHGSHIIFSKEQWVLNDLLALVPGSAQMERNTAIRTDEGFQTYPYENGMLKKSKEARERFYESIVGAPKIEHPKNLREVFVATFGEDACDYFFRYNEKIWKTPISELSASIGGRIPKPSGTYLENLKAGKFEEGYTHQSKFHSSPRGIVQMYKNLMEKVDFRRETRTVHGSEADNNGVIFTGYLDRLCKERGVRHGSLKKIGLQCLFFQTSRKMSYSWVYEASEEYPFNRVYNAFTNGNVMVFETTLAQGQKGSAREQAEAWIKENFPKIKVKKFLLESVTDYAYPVPTVKSDVELAEIEKKMPCRLFGRFGLWKYWNTDMCYMEAKPFVEKNF